MKRKDNENSCSGKVRQLVYERESDERKKKKRTAFYGAENKEKTKSKKYIKEKKKSNCTYLKKYHTCQLHFSLQET